MSMSLVPSPVACRHFFFAGATALLSACAAVGPDYGGPPDVAKASIESQEFARAPLAPAPATPVPPPARWWESVPDPLLTRLIQEAFAASPTLESAVARVRSAVAQQSVNRAALGPSSNISGRYVRADVPTDSLGSSGSGSSSNASSGSGNVAGTGTSSSEPIDVGSYSASLYATWEIDLFGGKRRVIESSSAAVQAQQAALEDAQVSLANDMAQAYVRLREAQTRSALARSTIALDTRTVELTRQRRTRGTASQGDVERAEVELAQARADVPGLQTQIEQQLDQIALLAGRESGAYDGLLAVRDDQAVESPMPPELAPVGQPAEWLRRRPDIRRAERTIASRNATIGSDTAALFPSVSLLGFIGFSGSHPGDLFTGSPIRALSPSLTWNFLDIPRNRARVRGAEADRDESIADYRRTVLAALQDANDSLSRFGRARETLALRDTARRAAARAAGFARLRYEGGTSSLVDSLDAERQRTQADDQWAQARANLMVAYASLQKSLGLGWGAPPPECLCRG